MIKTPRNYRLCIISCISFVLWFVLISGCLEDEEESPMVMTMKENIEDYVENVDNETRTVYGDFKSLEEGDTLIIRDIVNRIVFDTNTSVTYVEFESFTEYPLAFQGDLSYTFMPGDAIELRVHITQVTFIEQQDDGTNWTINLETFREGIDPTDNGFIPIPQQYISRPD